MIQVYNTFELFKNLFTVSYMIGKKIKHMQMHYVYMNTKQSKI